MYIADEWLVKMIMKLYRGLKTRVRVNGSKGERFVVNVGCTPRFNAKSSTFSNNTRPH